MGIINGIKNLYKGIGATGKYGEAILKTFGGKQQKYFPTILGRGSIDQFVEGWGI